MSHGGHTEKQKMNILVFSCVIGIVLYFWLAEDVFGLSGDDLLIWFVGILFASGLIVGVLGYFLGRISSPRKIRVSPDMESFLSKIGRSNVEFPIIMYGGRYEDEIHFYDSLESIVELGEGMVGAEHIIDSNLQRFTLSKKVFEDRDYYFEYDIPEKGNDITLDGVKELFKNSTRNIVEKLVNTGHQEGKYYYGIIDQIERASSLERIVGLLKDVY